jgi:phage minor structural protein, N-terminal region
MICYFDKNETNFTHNGKGMLDNYIISPTVYEELNGSFYLEFEYPIQAKYAGDLVPEMIVRCPVPELPDQLFRITERNEMLGGVMQVVAHHIFYDLAKNFIEDTFLVNRTGTQALNQILNSTQFNHRFSATSNILAANNARLVRLNPVEVFMDDGLDNGFRARWGGEIIRDNFSFSMISKRGSDNGVQIRDKKNLTGYKSNIDYSTIVTRIMPQGFDGLFLPEKYVDSPLINNYVSPKIKVIRYEGIKVGEEDEDFKTASEAHVALRAAAKQEYTVHQIDKPTLTYEVDFAPLQLTKEYQAFSALETINMGDVVSVIHEEDGLDISARMISYTFDPLNKAYKKITLGSILPKFTNINREIKRVDSKVEQAQTDANYALTSASGKNTNFYGTAKPTNPKIGDLWFKENGEKIEIWIYETREGITQWFVLSSDLTQEQIRQELDQARKDVDEAIIKSEEAVKVGEDAFNAGQQALEKGNLASELANQAKDDARQAVNNANTAFTQATNALTGVNHLTTRVTNAETTLTIQEREISSKATQSSVDMLTGRVTNAESTIKQTADSFTVSLASQSKVVNDMLGIHILQSEWSVGSINTAGNEIASTTHVRSGWFDVKGGERYLLQTREGTNAQTLYGTMVVYYYREDRTFISSVNVSTSVNPFIANVQAHFCRIRLVTSNSINTINCYLIQTEMASGWTAFDTISNLLKIQATSDTLLVRVGETQDAIGVPFVVHRWERGTLNTTTGAQTSSTTNLCSEFIDVTTGERFISQLLNGASLTGNYHFYMEDVAVPNTFIQLSRTATANAVTVPVGAVKMRVRVATSLLPEHYDGNVYRAIIRQDYSRTNSLYTALLMQNNLINFRVAKGEVINQINISPESILIAGNKIRITGQTTIDNAVIHTAMIANLAITDAKIASLAVTTAKIADAAITNAKIANLDAGKINTGTLNAGRIAARSITSDKLTVADGFITNAMIANATIQNAKIATLDAAKITTGTLNAARIAANSITADKVAANFLTALTGSSSIRITGTTISYFSGSNVVTQINSQGMTIRRDGVEIGRIGANNIANQSTWRGLVFNLENSANYMSWANRETASATTYTMKLAWYRSKLQNGMERGFHFSDMVYLRNGIGALVSNGTTATANVEILTLSNVAHLAIRTTNGRAGIAMAGAALVLGSNGTWVNFNTIRAICARLANRTIVLPSAINSQGQITSWFTAQNFESMTTWST